MKPSTVRAWRALVAFLHPAQFARRARERERVKLVTELNEIEYWRSWCNCREPEVVKRLQVLAREDGYQS